MLCGYKITQRAAQKMLSETTTACVRLFVFFRTRRGTFPYGVEDDASTISLTPTTHYINTCVKLTIVTLLSFSEHIAIANLSYLSVAYSLNGAQKVRSEVHVPTVDIIYQDESILASNRVEHILGRPRCS